MTVTLPSLAVRTGNRVNPPWRANRAVMACGARFGFWAALADVAAGTLPGQAAAPFASAPVNCQLILHPVWTRAGDRIATVVAGRPSEQYLMWTLVGLTAASVLYVLIGGGSAQ